MQQTVITKKRLVKRQFLNLFSNPTQLLVLSFAVMILAGSLLLSLPIATKSGESTAYLDALFTATSATCVTGLQLFDSYTHWTLFGQAVILVLIQLGGLGLVTLTSFFHIAIGKKMGFKNMHLSEYNDLSWAYINALQTRDVIIVPGIGNTKLDVYKRQVGNLLLGSKLSKHFESLPI